MYPLQDVFESLRKPGLYGIFSVPEMGKETVLAYFASSFSATGDKCLFISLEYSKEVLHDLSNLSKMNTDNIEIIDDISIDPCGQILNKILETIVSKSPKAVCIDNLILIHDKDNNKISVIETLRALSKQLSIPIVFASHLPRSTGDYEPFERRPELYDVLTSFPRESPLGECLSAIASIDIIMFLHRHHDCDRGVGTAHRYNISKMAELILKRKVTVPESLITYRFDIQNLFHHL